MEYDDHFPLAEVMHQAYSDVTSTEKDGVYTHTFTTVSSADITAMLEEMYANAQKEPQILIVTPKTYWRLKRVRLYEVHHLPRRKIRKCFLRKRQVRINQGKRHLLRCMKNAPRRVHERAVL